MVCGAVAVAVAIVIALAAGSVWVWVWVCGGRGIDMRCSAERELAGCCAARDSWETGTGDDGRVAALVWCGGREEREEE